MRPMMPMGGMKGPGQMAPMGKPVGGQNPQAAAMFRQMNQAPPPAVQQGLGQNMAMQKPMAMSNPAAQAPNPNRAALMQALMRPQANRQQRRPAPGPRPFIPGGLRRAGR